ncbi:hypothetical protein QAD02_018941 [Eretmocerus hayati]|uniref:Uncharacterized protein n=1 Tax=Eretmocerus hayati TaxID=131215 RepID=A0ACC2PKR0_9HYME|nr:hypothetical protein QAD02_018941 [Eretmocerus hayati]
MGYDSRRNQTQDERKKGGDYTINSDCTIRTADMLPKIHHAQQELVYAISNNSGWLALHLDQQLSQERPGQNIIISPSCLQMALALVLLASRGDTSLQIAEVLSSFDGKISSSDLLEKNVTFHIHEILRRTFEANDKRRDISSQLQMQHSSGIFIQGGYRLRRQYLSYSRYLYKSDVISTNFKKEASKTQNLINSWVKNKTRGKIPTLLSTPPDPSTKLMIFSTLYFKSEWEQPFGELAKRETFTIQTGRTIDVTMLFATRDCPYFISNNGVKMIGLPYKGREVWMYVILPKSNGIDGLRTLKRSLTPKIVNEVIKNMKVKSVSVKIPKMKLTTIIKMNKAFRNLGVGNLFDPARADLSGLLDTSGSSSNLYVSDIVHAVEIAIDQNGTEAAAATAVSLVNRLDADPAHIFHVDRPFIFFIRNEKTKSILFWSSVIRPE